MKTNSFPLFAAHPLTQEVGELNLDLRNFAPGIYYYQLISNGTLIASDKLAVVKTH
ncbi:MAG: hypothetical protein IPL33_15870 [Sphingobacteriales bacterium]|nr:hypothetical protein [Sphingobacteriales bacterium]